MKIEKQINHDTLMTRNLKLLRSEYVQGTLPCRVPLFHSDNMRFWVRSVKVRLCLADVRLNFVVVFQLKISVQKYGSAFVSRYKYTP